MAISLCMRDGAPDRITVIANGKETVVHNVGAKELELVVELERRDLEAEGAVDQRALVDRLLAFFKSTRR